MRPPTANRVEFRPGGIQISSERGLSVQTCDRRRTNDAARVDVALPVDVAYHPALPIGHAACEDGTSLLLGRDLRQDQRPCPANRGVSRR